MRCFIAIQLDDQIIRSLAQAQGLFANLEGEVRWVKPQQMHLSLQFLGDVPDKDVPDITAVIEVAAREVQPFEFSVEQLGCFPEKGPIRVIWTGVDGPEELFKLQRACQDGLAELGFKAEKRAYKAHLTLGRAKSVPGSSVYRQVIDAHRTFRAGSQFVDKIVLFSSQLRPSGAVHTALAEVRLGR